MKFIALVLFVLVVAALVFLSRGRRRNSGSVPSAAGASAKLTDGSKFHAVSLNTGSNACQEARTTEGTRYLAGSAPRLPLPGCDAADCQCSFVHHTDRRGSDDRRTPYPSPIGLDARTHGNDQRKDSDRRQDPPSDSF